MRLVVVVATLAAVGMPSIAGAQSFPLTESEALARLSPSSPRVRAIRSSIDVARADVVAANRWPNPRVTFDREAVAGVTENMIMVSQALPITGRRGFDVQSATALVDAASVRADEAVKRARADLRVAFAQLVSAQVRERELGAALEHLRGLAEVLSKREAAGDAAGFDRLRAEREVIDIDADRAAAATERARAQAAVAGLLGDTIDPSTIVALEASKPRPPMPPLSALVEQAESTRGELAALRKEIEAARLSARSADRRRLPEPEVAAGSKSSTAGGGDTGSVITVHATVPLFDRGRPERALAEARATQAAARAEAFQAALRADISALRAAVVERRDTLERYRSAVSGSADIERIAQLSYDAGERGILELLDAYRTGASARIRQAALATAVRQAEIELEFVSGWEMPQ